ncbi:MAG: OmpA-like Outer rane domain protein [Myxococcales bacterium]|nr:OmpA-like Outer rane domain protein [Myxococcales bacterium]
MSGNSVIASSLGVLLMTSAAAADVSLKLEPGVAVPLSKPQSEIFDVGGGQAMKLLFGISPSIDIGPSVSFLYLPSAAPMTESGVAWGFGGGLRIKRPHNQTTSGTSPWLDADALFMRTGDLSRFGFGVAVGIAFPVDDAKAIWVGPFVRYQQTVNTERAGYDTRDAKILLAGLSFEVGTAVKRAPVERIVIEKVIEPAPAPEPLPPQVITHTVQSCPDRDADTVPDNIDQCPDVSGPITSAGCPVVAKVVITKDKLELKERLYFAWNRAEIKAVSFSILDEVVKVLQDNPTLHILVEGHTDASGNAGHNKRLSLRRAQSVVGYLKSHGIGRDRLTAKGFGPGVPLGPNDTADGREKNRRVEFTIVSIIPNEKSSK